SENRRAPPLLLAQLPPGAASVTSGPRLLKPTLLPTWRIAATAATPGQFAGDETAVPSLPGGITTTTSRARGTPRAPGAVPVGAAAFAEHTHRQDGRVPVEPGAAGRVVSQRSNHAR